ncbi:SMC-Scp complex subunit ScpB [Propionibacterium sp.]|uniref:SMC-Scp complex subunit ScpB n=1 Tax=Propionibacterium sp. TaxID=1977903 RepID=UPI0039EAA365
MTKDSVAKDSVREEPADSGTASPGPTSTQSIADATPPSAEEIAPLLECLLLMAEEPLEPVVLAEAAGAPVPLVEQTLRELADRYTMSGRGFQLRQLGGAWGYATRPEYHDRIAAWVRAGGQNRLSQAAMETLSVIAYLQPVPRSRVSAVRGVTVDAVVRTLIARGLVEERGTDDHSGAGLLVTTSYFLGRLGLNSLSELPDIAPLLPDASALEAELSNLADRTGSESGVMEQASADEENQS